MCCINTWCWWLEPGVQSDPNVLCYWIWSRRFKKSLKDELDSQVKRLIIEDRDSQTRKFKVVVIGVALKPNDEQFICEFLQHEYSLPNVSISNVCWLIGSNKPPGVGTNTQNHSPIKFSAVDFRTKKLLCRNLTTKRELDKYSFVMMFPSQIISEEHSCILNFIPDKQMVNMI